MWTIFYKYRICYNIASVLCFVLSFGCEACGVLVSLIGMDPIPPALEGEILTTESPGRFQQLTLYLFKLFLIGEKLLYNAVFVSTIQLFKLAKVIHMPPPS